MIELVLNEFLNTFPFHILGYMPFHDRLRFSVRRTAFHVCLWEAIYLCLFAILVSSGFPLVLVQYLAVPVFLILMYYQIAADFDMVTFLFIFILDYLMVIRAAVFFILKNFPSFSYSSWQAGCLNLLLVLSTIYFMLKALSHVIAGVSAIRIPHFWKGAWLLSLTVSLAILILTGDLRSGNFKSTAFIARLMLLGSVFLVSHLTILFIKNTEEQIAASTQNQIMENLLHLQREQYTMLQANMDANRRARHDFRQHRRVIQDFVNREDYDSLKSYLAEYEKQFPAAREHVYCGSHAVNAILSYYAEQAENYGIDMTINMKMADNPVIPETEFCVLIGNLIENAMDACRTSREASPEPITPFIRLLVNQIGPSMLSIATDNTSTAAPVWDTDHLVSDKPKGNGIGTQSIRYIAKRYDGDARFEWKDGVFYASVLLNPQ